MNRPELSEFEKAAQESDDRGVLAEFWGFLAQNRKWWLGPIILLLLFLGLLIFLSSTGFAPLVYTLF
jgi:hypothetical protein